MAITKQQFEQGVQFIVAIADGLASDVLKASSHNLSSTSYFVIYRDGANVSFLGNAKDVTPRGFRLYFFKAGFHFSTYIRFKECSLVTPQS